MRYYLVCNWKMSPSSFLKARGLLDLYNKEFSSQKRESWLNRRLVVCPPFTYFQLLEESRKTQIRLGSQDIAWNGKEMQTGKISGKMLKNFGTSYVLIGHSELRDDGDSEYRVLLKIKEAIKNSIIPIVFLGHSDYIKEVRSVLNSFGADQVNKMIFVYEPRSSIGKDRPSDPDDVAEAIREIKKNIYIRFKKSFFSRMTGIGSRNHLMPHPAILYGGSVDANNYKKFLKIPDLNGFVVGRESMFPGNLKKIFEDLAK